MNIDKISARQLEFRSSNKNAFRNSNYMQYDSSINNDMFIKEKTSPNIKRLGSFVAALMIALSGPMSALANIKKPAKNIENYSNLGLKEVVSIAEDNEFQRNQQFDAPSLTFDLTGNWTQDKYTPSSSLAYLSKNPNGVEKFNNLRDVITTLYNIEDSEENQHLMFLAALSILKANPHITAKITGGLVEFNDGDVANIDPELILDTDYTVEGAKIPVFVPEFSPLVETGADKKSSLVASTVIRPKNANEFGQAVVQVTPSELKSIGSEAELMALLNEKVQNTYGLRTMNSYAADAVWHAIELYNANYDETAFSSEGRFSRALYESATKNRELSLVAPSAPVTIISGKNIDTNDFLYNTKPQEGKISYITADRAVVSISELGGKYATPLQILNLYTMDGVVSLKEAYEAEPEKYEGLVLAAYRQIIDNNDAMIRMYGNGNITAANLNESLEGMGANTKINLQPLAYEEAGYVAPASKATKKPTATPYIISTPEPTAVPTATPTAEPTATPTAVPTATPTAVPTATPTAVPTATPTAEPTATPEPCTPNPTNSPEPSVPPTKVPRPTQEPTNEPTKAPTQEPTKEPTPKPTPEPTKEPTPEPTKEPTPKPTPEPTPKPTDVPCPPDEVGSGEEDKEGTEGEDIIGF